MFILAHTCRPTFKQQQPSQHDHRTAQIFWFHKRAYRALNSPKGVELTASRCRSRTNAHRLMQAKSSAVSKSAQLLTSIKRRRTGNDPGVDESATRGKTGDDDDI